MVVARGASLVSAAQSSDAGLGDADTDEGPQFGVGGGGSSEHHLPNHSSTLEPHGTGGTGGSSSSSSSSSSSDSKHH